MSSILEQIRSGNHQLQLLAADGVLPLPPEELIPLQVELAQGEDSEVALRAKASLRTTDVRLAGSFLERTAGNKVLAWFAEEASHPVLIEAILRRRDTPRLLLTRLARRLPPDLQELLLLRQDAIVEQPAILEALEENPEVSTYTLRRIAEYREHLLPRERTPVVRAPAAPEEMDEEELAEAIEAARELPALGELEPERTKLTEGQIRMLPVPARLKLTRGAPRTLRSILLRDSNVQVATSVVINNALSDQEVEQIASSRTVVEEVLILVARRRDWVGKYNIMKALVANPRTPTGTALRLVPRLVVRDLRDLGRDRNIPDAIRSTALRLYRIKQK
ncbi:MAG TPA: hypothetical protein VGS07_16650 [Thermoanaerobaculia bacterium]|jgi:hypothetical protein|nr:hypothetical protein [Thermoanaerobaculia bacterium]